jgi:septal ring factor EnvC (AmiA/AmiB activator)
MKKCNVIKAVWLFTFLFSLCAPTFGQKDRKDLESQRKALESQIKSTTDVLNKTQKNKTKSVNQLKALSEQIRQRQALLDNINAELREVNQQASLQEKNKLNAEARIRDLESRMAGALRTAYFRSQLHPDWIYLLSASSLAQLMQRWVYLRQYKTYVAGQLTALATQKEQYRALLRELEANKAEKTVLLKVEEKNKNEIVSEQKNKEAIVKELSKEEKKLKTQLATAQEKKKKLDSEISRIISAEGTKMTSSGLKTAPETKKLNDQFASNKGKLPWPVSKGLITDRFGTHAHPVLKGITVQNNGIDIQAEPNGNVKSLFNGTVASVTKIPGYDYMVMVRHGIYFTVYSLLQTVTVKKGDNVTTGQVLGTLGTEEPELHLEIWQDKTKLNPESWISKK